VLAGGGAALAGLELVRRRRLVPLGWWLVASAPAEAGLLLAANWRTHVDPTVASGLVTATTLLLSGLVVGTLALLVDDRAPLGRLGLTAVAGCTVVVDALALVATWADSLTGEGLRALISLVFLTLLLYAATPLAQRHSKP
jgi:hypothetical protein